MNKTSEIKNRAVTSIDIYRYASGTIAPRQPTYELVPLAVFDTKFCGPDTGYETRGEDQERSPCVEVLAGGSDTSGILARSIITQHVQANKQVCKFGNAQ